MWHDVQYTHIYKGGDRPMSNADIAEINLLKKRQNNAESRARMRRRNREIRKRRERMMIRWINESDVKKSKEIVEICAIKKI